MHTRILLILAFVTVLLSSCEDTASDASLLAGSGIGGSMAQFTIHNGQLYLLTEDKLKTFSLQNPAAPAPSNTQTLGPDVETLFPYNGNLFVGTQNGMHIYSLSNPAIPAYVSTFRHITSCDPVVVEGNYAYVTLRSGTTCNMGANELQIIDISQLERPELISQIVMQSPYGLAVKEGIAYVCNGDQGLTVMNLSNPYDPQLIKEYKGFNGYDVIFTTRSLMIVGTTGLVQYDASNPASLRQLSVIPVKPQM